MINSPLMRYMNRRISWIYWFLLAFSLLGFLGVLGPAIYDTTIILHWEKHPFFPMGLMLALIWGMGILTREFRKGSLLEFVLSRPVSRNEFYNTILLTGAVPLLILMFLPLVYVAALYPWFYFSISLWKMFFICIIAASWVMVILLLGLNIGLWTGAYSFRRYGRAFSAFVIAVLVAILFNLASNINTELGNPALLAQNYPWLTLTTAFLSAAALYYLGLRRVEKMDI